MPILRKIVCDVCGQAYTEREAGHGFPGWGAFHGIKLDGVDNPQLCPVHKAAVADFIDELKHGPRPAIAKR